MSTQPVVFTLEPAIAPETAAPETTAPETAPPETTAPETAPKEQKEKISVLDLPINSHTDALNIMEIFLRIGVSRGMFTMEEVVKIHACFQKFQTLIPKSNA